MIFKATIYKIETLRRDEAKREETINVEADTKMYNLSHQEMQTIQAIPETKSENSLAGCCSNH